MTNPEPELFEMVANPDLESPVLVLALEGWVEAAGATRASYQQIKRSSEMKLITRFNTDRLLDHRARRPTMKLVDGVIQRLDWPAIEINLLEQEGQRPLLLLHGPEPDHEWKSFAQSVVKVAIELNVELVVGLGSYPAAVPHTRPTRIACTASTPELVTKLEFVTATLEIPAGIQASIEVAAAAAGIPAIGIWAQVPHYLSATGFPPATMALLEGFTELTGIEIGLGPLVEKSLATRSRLDDLIVQNPEHVTMLEKLEEAYDNLHDSRIQLPSGEDLAAELERFLRDQ
ncbi:MAG: proteasome assembly chaperone family protein [Acidimicrobiales bacterium]|nr:PAC2 family protein [Acidimicrobiaceae bacterium]|tara:strand:- start:2641 stop:3504 length:864 start_codon:yes stop_codon:yes gene_type:complete